MIIHSSVIVHAVYELCVVWRFDTDLNIVSHVTFAEQRGLNVKFYHFYELHDTTKWTDALSAIYIKQHPV